MYSKLSKCLPLATTRTLQAAIHHCSSSNSSPEAIQSTPCARGIWHYSLPDRLDAFSCLSISRRTRLRILPDGSCTFISKRKCTTQQDTYLRNRVHELHSTCQLLVACKALLHMCLHILLTEFAALSQHHESLRQLYIVVPGFCDDGCIDDFGMSSKYSFD